jgi:hypothetical protein
VLCGDQRQLPVSNVGSEILSSNGTFECLGHDADRDSACLGGGEQGCAVDAPGGARNDSEAVRAQL